MQVVVQGLLTHYSKRGQGPVMVFLHGWGSNAAVFDALSSKFSDSYTTIALDLPGFGSSQIPKTAWGLDEYAVFVAEFLQKLQIKDVAVLVAHSNGAAIAVKALSHELMQPKKLVIYGGAGIRQVQKGKKKFLRIMASAGKPVLMALPGSTRKKVRGKWYEAIGSEMLLVPEMEATFKKTVSEDVVSLTRNILIPTLLLYGENDEATPPLYGQIFFENFPNAQLEIVGNAGHFVFVDQQDVVIRLTKDFLG